MFVVVFILIGCNRALFALMVDKRFAEAATYAPFLYAGTLFSSLSAFYGSIYVAAGRTKPIISTTILGALCSVILSLICVPRFGLYGSVCGFAGGFFVTWIARVVHSRMVFSIALRSTTITGITLIMLGACVVADRDSRMISPPLIGLCLVGVVWMLKDLRSLSTS
jgi:O-antigen/teichoic acid export membrane protein